MAIFLHGLSWFVMVFHETGFQRTGFQRTGYPLIFIDGYPSMRSIDGYPSMNICFYRAHDDAHTVQLGQHVTSRGRGYSKQSVLLTTMWSHEIGIVHK